jgi:hypothetical protein
MKLACLLLASSVVISMGCSDDDPSADDGSGGSGGESASGSEKWWCTCAEGGSVQVDPPAESQCASFCQDLGGMLSVEPVISAVGTAECDAFCAAADALGCPGDSCKSKEDFWCEGTPGDCTEAVKAQLQCKAEMGEFSCDDDSWQSSAPCGTFEELCAE